MSDIAITPLHRDFGARITSVQLSGDVSQETIRAIRDAVDTYSLLVFPDQNMTDDRQLAFTRLLGEPEAEHVHFGKTGEVVYFGTVGNVNEDGTKKGGTHANTKYQSGNQLWHSDSSFRETPSYVSILHAYEVPDEGGATGFASQRVAYGRLSDDDKRMTDTLKVVHDYVFSRSPIAPVDPNHAASLPPVMHDLVRVNPANGLRNLYIGSHARSVPGLSGIESRKLLDRLIAFATEPAYIYSHQWRAGDTVIWDNRCMLHCGTPYDADKWRRHLRQTRVIGDVRGMIQG